MVQQSMTYGGISGQGNGLGAGTMAVNDIDIVHLEVAGVDTESARLIVTDAAADTDAGGDGHDVVGVSGVIGGVAVDGQRTLEGGNQDLLAVGAGVDEDGLCCRRGGRQGINSSLDLAVLTAATDDQGAGWCSSPAGCQSQAGIGSCEEQRLDQHICG